MIRHIVETTRKLLERLAKGLHVSLWVGVLTTPALLHPALGLDEAGIRQLFDEGKWAEIVKKLDPSESGLPPPQETQLSAFHYYLGTAYLNVGLTGRARAHLERARQASSRSAAVNQNLELARSRLARTLGAERVDPASDWVELLGDRWSREELRTLIGFLGVVTMGLWLRTYLRRKRTRALFSSGPGMMGMVLFLLLCFLAFIERSSHLNPPAVLLDAAVIRSGPGDSFMEIGRLEAGSKIRWINDGSAGPQVAGNVNGEWLRVRFTDSRQGWVQRSKVLQL